MSKPTRHVGLTDDPARAKAEHANPCDWSLETFDTEDAAYDWQQMMLAAGFHGDGEDGWHFGYTYTERSHLRDLQHGRAA